jgi:hypothetical protein
MSEYAHLIWAGICIQALVAGALFERHEGAQACINRDTQAETKQEVQQGVKLAHGEDTSKEIGSDFDAATHNPPAGEPLHLLMCTPAQPPRARPVSSPSPAAAQHHGAAPVPQPDPGAQPAARDIGPALDSIGTDADAQVIALQRYVTDVCLAKH